MLHLNLLGRFRLTEGDAEIHLTHGRFQELLARLTLAREQTFSRQKLAFLLWPDSSEAQARTNLRNLLFKLSKVWPAATDYLYLDRSHVGWRTEAPVAIDVLRFEAAVARADAAQPHHVERALWDAAGCYGGDLLPGHYDEWLLVERDWLHGHFRHVLERLAQLLEEQRRYDEAIVQAERLLQADPLQETGCRLLMRLYAAKGDRAAALRTYQDFASLLDRELGAPPSLETEELFQRLLHKESSLRAEQPTLVQTLPLVGRHLEWRQLLGAWQAARRGRPRLVLISGEAGIGKTRLAMELVDKLAHQGHSTASSRVYAVEGALAYAPVGEWLGREPIRQAVAQMDPLWQVEIARLLPDILIEHPDLPAPGPLREGWQRQRFFEAMMRVFLTLPQPLLLHMDDLQWCDQETLNFLHYFLQAAAPNQVLLVGTARSEEMSVNHPLQRLLHLLRQDDLAQEIELGPLNAEETATLAAQAMGETLADPVREQLVRESEGHPLFLVEITRMRRAEAAVSHDNDTTGLAAGETAVGPPPKIQAIIDARLAQLSTHARELAHLAAVVGREFTLAILQAVGNVDEETLILALDELWQRRIVRELEGGGYDFSHDRIREVAYAQFSRIRRRFYHRRVAEYLADSGPENLDALSGRLAFHYEASGDSEQAVAFYLQAGDYALASYSGDRGLHYFKKALSLVTETETRVAALGGLGYAHFALDETEKAIAYYDQALSLCADASPYRAKLLYRLADAHFARFDPDAAEPFVMAALTAAEACDDKETLCQALSLSGQIHGHRGDPATEQLLVRRALGLARQTGNRWREAHTLADLGFIQAQFGDFAGAADAASAALELLQATGDLAGQAFAWNIFGRAEGGRGRYGAAFAAFARSEELAGEIHLHAIAAQIPNMRGWLYQQLCDYHSAHAANLQGLDLALRWQKDAAEISARLNLCFDAIYLGRAQEAYETLGTIEARLAQNDFGFHGWRWRVRLLHTKGLALLALERPDAALVSAQAGMELAHKTQVIKYIALNHHLTALAHATHGNTKVAIAHEEQALVLADRMHYQPLRREGRQCLAALHRAHGEDARAAIPADEARQILHAIAAEIPDPERRKIFVDAATGSSVVSDFRFPSIIK